MNPATLVQGSEEWRKYKCGRLGGSSISQMMAKSRDKKTWGTTRETLLTRLVVERMTGCPQDSYVSEAMKRGTETEAQARSMYCLLNNCDVEQAGWIDHPTIKFAGMSPDGLVGQSGLVEFKCPESKKHMGSLLGGSIDREYLMQVQWQMACTGRDWVDFATYDPRWPPEMQLLVTRVPRDDVVIANLELEAVVFLKEVEDTVSQLRAKYQLLEAAE